MTHTESNTVFWAPSTKSQANLKNSLFFLFGLESYTGNFNQILKAPFNKQIF